MKEKERDFLIKAEHKALATTYQSIPNVVPVSEIDVDKTKIYLFNFYMGKTTENLKTNQNVGLTAWSGTHAMKYNGRAVHMTCGAYYDRAKERMKKKYPDRTLHGVIEIDVMNVEDISLPQ